MAFPGPVSQYVADNILKMISEGAFPEGRLPAERLLCSKLKVSRTALRSALRVLEERGLVERVHGRGTFIHAPEPPADSARAAIALFHGLAPVDLGAYYRGIIDGALWEAEDRGLDILFARLGAAGADAGLSGRLGAISIRGALMLAFHEDEVRRMGSLGMPVVMVDMPSSEMGCVVADDELGARMAVRHLGEELSHRRISYILWSRHRTISQYRLEGYRRGTEELGLEARAELVTEAGSDYLGPIQAAERLMSLPEPPTAIVCDSDSIARGVIEGIRGCGRSVPEDVSVMAIGAPGGVGQLAAITFDVEEIGRCAVRELVRQLDMPFSKPRRTVIPPRLVRGSTCAPAR